MSSSYTVTYSCDCERFYPIEYLYYCHTCQKLMCPFCITQEIDSYYCPNCLENMPSAEALTFKNCCKKCFECPLCFSALGLLSSEVAEGKTKTIFYCGLCRWSCDLKAETPQQLIAKNLEMEKEDLAYKEVTKLIESLQKQEKERAKERRQQTRMKQASVIMGKTHVLPMKPITSASEIERKIEKQKTDNLASLSTTKTAVFRENDNDEYNNNVNINSITSLAQRYENLTAQPTNINDLAPQRKPLLTRLSKHCASCEKLLVKPDLNPTKIDFKRQHVALLYVPRIVVARVSPLNLESASEVLLKIRNPVHNYVDFSITAESNSAQVCKNCCSQVDSQKIDLEPLQTFLAPKDHDDEDNDPVYKEKKAGDNGKVIQERKGNSVYIKMSVKPLVTKDIQVELNVKGKYTTAASGEMNFEFKSRIELGELKMWSKVLPQTVFIK